MPSVEATITGDNQFTPEISITAVGFTLSLSGTFVATFTVQRSFDDTGVFRDIKQYTAPAEEIGEDFDRNNRFRFGVKTGDFTSGTGVARLSFAPNPIT